MGRGAQGDIDEGGLTSTGAGVRMLLVPALVMAALGLTAQAPAPTRSQPLPIARSSLTQNGQQLVWRVQLGAAFSPGALAAAHREVCLLIERARDGTVIRKICVTARGGRPALHSSAVTSGRVGSPHAIPATITRSSSSQLTASFLPSAVGLGYQPVRWQAMSGLTPPVCSAMRLAAPPCSVLLPARPTLLAIHVPRVSGCVASGPSEVFRGSSQRRQIALTFDDGPWSSPPTSDFVRLLAREHVPATFFEVGVQIGQFDPGGSVERAMLAAGDMLGGHSWTHPNMTRLTPAAQRAQLSRTTQAIAKRTGFTPCLWRPPYGYVNQRLVVTARSLGMLTIMWDVDPRDWARPGASTIAGRVISAAHNGAIVIQHYGGGPRQQTLAALPREIAVLRGRGYRFVTVAQLLGLRLIYR